MLFTNILESYKRERRNGKRMVEELRRFGEKIKSNHKYKPILLWQTKKDSNLK